MRQNITFSWELFPWKSVKLSKKMMKSPNSKITNMVNGNKRHLSYMLIECLHIITPLNFQLSRLSQELKILQSYLVMALILFICEKQSHLQ